MDLFEYILIMTSVIFAMAVGQLLMGLGRWAQSPARVRAYLPHALWVAIVFLMIFANWWANWEFRSIAWTLPTYAYMVVSPTVLFFACGLLLPESFEPPEVDLEEHFHRVRRPFLIAVFVALVATLADGALLGTEPVWHTGRIGHAVMVSAMLAGILIENRRLQTAVAALVLCGLVWGMTMRLWTHAG